MAEQPNPGNAPVQVERRPAWKSGGRTIIWIILIIALVTLGIYGFMFLSSDEGKLWYSDFFYTVGSKYNIFAWYAEQIKGATELQKGIWSTEKNKSAEDVGIKFKDFEAIGSKIVPAGTSIALRYKFDVGEGVHGVTPKLECEIRDKTAEQVREEEIIESKTIIPEKIEIFSENPLSYSNVLCQVTTRKKSGDRMIAVKGKVSFPFQQRGSLKVYLTKDIVNIGKDFFEKSGIEEKLPIKAKYSKEPVELGIGVSDENIQPVIIGKNQYPAVGISLRNAWDGRVTKVKEMSLILPGEVKIDKKNSPASLLCPFGKPTTEGEKTKYKSEKTYLDHIPIFGKGAGKTLETSQKFFCWLEIDDSVLEGKPFVTKYYSVEVSYDYELREKQETITLKGAGWGEETKKTEANYYLCKDKVTEEQSCIKECAEKCAECKAYNAKEECEKQI